MGVTLASKAADFNQVCTLHYHHKFALSQALFLLHGQLKDEIARVLAIPPVKHLALATGAPLIDLSSIPNERFAKWTPFLVALQLHWPPRTFFFVEIFFVSNWVFTSSTFFNLHAT
jgi:hypothetical protein